MEFHVIKENDLFYLSTVQGNIPANHVFGYGLYTRDTRVLSELEFQVHPSMLMELKADDSQNYQAVYEYTNREVWDGDELRIGRESLKIRRRQFVDGSRFYEEGTADNYAARSSRFEIQYRLGADFRDMFEVRGMSRGQERGVHKVERGPGWLRFTYIANDGLESQTAVRLVVFSTEDPIVEGIDSSLGTEITVPPHGQVRWLLVVEPTNGVPGSMYTLSENVLEEGFRSSYQTVSGGYEEWLSGAPRVDGDELFKNWYLRGLKDIRMLLTDLGHGYFPVAGVPWYAVPFGRDSLITSLQLLLANPGIAKGTLMTMMAYQGTKVDPSRDEQPGKIMHELRTGELTRTGEVPFGPYYGTIDATALFLNLAADYYAWTGDTEFIASVIPNVEAAFHWIESYGDRDGDGFVEYFQEASKGIANQGWKDSGDSVVHKDGSLARGPIALCEVQGYTYRAYQRWSQVFAAIDRLEQARSLRLKAEHLQARFVQSFWLDDESSVALALDGDKNQVRSHSSNMGQVLWSGILPAQLAARLADRMLKTDLFNGFGVRTLSSRETAYNPLSYHNGSIWPHDNSLIVAGMQSYGHVLGVTVVTGGLLEAARGFRHMRLPELFSGFGTEEVNEPLPYPVSCSPQAWAAATPIFLLQSMLGIEPSIDSPAIRLNPVLPPGIRELRITGVHIGGGQLDVLLVRSESGETALNVSRNTTGRPLLVGITQEVTANTAF